MNKINEISGVLVVLGEQRPVQEKYIFLKPNSTYIINFVTFKMFKNRFPSAGEGSYLQT